MLMNQFNFTNFVHQFLIFSPTTHRHVLEIVNKDKSHCVRGNFKVSNSLETNRY